MGAGAIVAMVFGGIALFGCAFCVFGGFVPAVLNQDPGSGKGDVRITDCGETVFGNGRAVIEVTNSANRTQTYWVTVAFFDGSGTRLATGTAYINGVAAGGKAVDEVIGAVPEGRSASRCAVTDVNRF